MVASLAAALSIGMVAGAYADEVVDGFSYEGIGVGATIYNADVEFGEITMSIESPEGGTLTMEMDTTVLAPASDDGVVVMLDGFLAEPTIDVSDSTITITLEVPAGTTEVILSGIADAAEVAASAAQAPGDEPAADEPAAEPATEPAAEPATEPAAEPATEPAAEPATEPAAEPATEPAASVPAIQPTGEVAEFVEPGVDASVYVDRYLNDAEFAAWYDQWYPGQAFYSAVGITQAEYQSIADSIRGPIQCPEDTEMVDGVCVRYQMSCGPGTEMVDGVCVLTEAPAAQPTAQSAPETTSATALEVYEAQGEGLQIGVAAVGGFSIAIAILLLLFLPHRIRRWHRARRQTAEA